jgi:hypothetical protein
MLKVHQLSPEMMLRISIALKPTLKVLAIHDDHNKTDAQLLLPICKTLRESLEGLSTGSMSYLVPAYNLSFPKLRMIAVDHYLCTSIQ